MEDRDEKVGSEPEIEAHRGKKGLKASDEPKAGETSDEGEEADVELHKKKLTK